ncbi:MAG: hypothetical protein ACHQIO_20225, partial [Nevskiales bacterium]
GPMMDLAQQAKLHPDARPSPEVFRHTYMHMMFMNPLVRLLSMVVKTMVLAAVFRAVLEPKRRAFAYLRISMQEVWILLVQIVEAILIDVGAFAAILVAGQIIAAVAHFASHEAAAIVGVIAGIVGIIGLFWVLLRLSLATPMSFEDSAFRLFESWKLTRGRAFSLLMMAILLFIILILLEGVAFAVIGVPMMMFVHPHVAGDHVAMHEAMLTFLKQPPQVMLQTVGPVAAICALVGSFVIGAVSAIFYAPWAAAYRMLRPEASAS